jgi:hypothetical protein
VEIIGRQLSISVQSWTRRAEVRHPLKVQSCSELRGRVQRAILEAEQNEDFDKKDQLPSLLRLFEIDHDFRNRNNREK